MDITSAQYFAENDINLTIKAMVDGHELHIPIDPSNRHYAEIMRQVAAGTLTIAEAD